MKYLRLLILFITAGYILFMSSCEQPWHPDKQDYESQVDPYAVAFIQLCTGEAYKNDSLKKKYNNLLQKAAKEKDSITYSYLAARVYKFYKNMDTAIAYNKLAYGYLKNHSEFAVPLANTCYNIGQLILSSSNNIYEANYYMTHGTSIVTAANLYDSFDAKWLEQAFINTIRVNRVCGQMETANKNLYPALNISNKNIRKNSQESVAILTEAVELFSEMRRFDSASLYLAQLVKVIETYNPPKTLGALYEASATYYLKQNNYDSSLNYYLKAVEYNLTCKCPTSYRVFDDYLAILKLYSLKKMTPKANEYFKIINTNKDPEDSVQQLALLEPLIYYNLATGNNAKATALFTEYQQRKEATYNADRLKMFAAVNEEFEIEEKSRKIANLYEEKSLAASEIRLKNNLILTLVIVFLLVGIIFYLLLGRRKYKAQQQILEAYNNKIEVEQQLLRTQMEPHFIFNTLAVLQSQVRSGEIDKAGKYLNRFARLLRLSLENSRQKNVPLAQEMDALENYVALQAMRFEDMFTYDFDIYEGYKEDAVLIPPMLFQPFVENAIHHGLRNIDHKGHISIVIEKRYKVIYCRISDNGRGFEESKEEAHKQSLSTKITTERLDSIKKQTGINSALHINTGPSGTTVEIIVPFTTDMQF